MPPKKPTAAPSRRSLRTAKKIPPRDASTALSTPPLEIDKDEIQPVKSKVQRKADKDKSAPTLHEDGTIESGHAAMSSAQIEALFNSPSPGTATKRPRPTDDDAVPYKKAKKEINRSNIAPNVLLDNDNGATLSLDDVADIVQRMHDCADNLEDGAPKIKKAEVLFDMFVGKGSRLPTIPRCLTDDHIRQAFGMDPLDVSATALQERFGCQPGAQMPFPPDHLDGTYINDAVTSIWEVSNLCHSDTNHRPFVKCPSSLSSIVFPVPTARGRAMLAAFTTLA